MAAIGIVVTKVRTIRGPVEVSDLGTTLAHEHLTTGTSGMQQLPGLLDRPAMTRRCLDALTEATAVGIQTVIDLTPFDLGRQPWLFEAVASETEAHLICATGIYRWVPPIFFAWDADEIAAFFVSEIENGIQGSHLRAGIIKVAWDLEYRLADAGANPSPREMLERVARAAGRAARATGVPIACHTLASDKLGTPLLDIFEDEGVDLAAVTVGHSNDTDDLDYLTGLAERGAVLGLDRFRLTTQDYVERRSALVLELIRLGFCAQLTLGHDVAPAGFWGRWSPEPDPRCWTLVSEFELPWLRANGATEEDVNAIMVDSVRTMFTAAARMAS